VNIKDLVLISSKTDGDLDGRIGIFLQFVDEYLRPWDIVCISKRIRERYAKVMLSDGSMRYLCPNSIRVL